VLCHQCGGLFSGTNDDCEVFDSSAQSQRKYCQPGEACLYYSWQKSSDEVATIRECFSPSILLGSVDKPLRVKSTCTPRDISETPGASIMACLCDNDLCNANDDKNDAPVAFPLIADPPTATQFSNVRNEPTRPTQDDFPDDVLNDLIALNGFNQIPESPKSSVPNDEPFRRLPETTTTRRPQTSRPVSRRPSSNSNGPLKCFSCGSLLGATSNCTDFNPSDPKQVQVCGVNEACLLYKWKKSSTETAVLRECFPKSVVLGPLDRPLLPSKSCDLNDVSEPEAGITDATACLCETSFCNNKQDLQSISLNRPPAVVINEFNEVEEAPPEFNKTPQRVPDRKTSPVIKEERDPIRLPSQQSPSRRKTACPRGFDLIGGGCYKVSNERMGWIEAKKMCEAAESHLVSFQNPDEATDLIRFVQRVQPRRTRFEFWTAGNDIDKENSWVWSSSSAIKEPVPDFGWIDRPFPSAEENCLTWSITVTNRRRGTISEGWHSDSCCNNIYFICELD